MSANLFVIDQYVVLPEHGCGKLVNQVEYDILDQKVQCFEIYFEKDDTNIFIPVHLASKKGLRSLISKEKVNKVYVALKEQSKSLKVIWSKRSQEYEKKILSGDIISSAEVVHDLYRNINNPNRSYSERIIYERALYRVVSEVALVMDQEYSKAEEKINDILSKYHETYQDILDAQNQLSQIA